MAHSSKEESKALDTFKKPPDPSELAVTSARKRRVKVLDEDEYVAKVERIVERDFFPELEKLRARSAFIDASDRNDTAEMRRLRERFSTGRIPTDAIRSRMSTPSTFETPERSASSMDPTASTSSSSAGSAAVVNDGGETSKKPKDDLEGVRLDKFMSKHTSEDNESFQELCEESDAEFRRTHEWMFKNDEQLSIENKSQQLALPSIEDQSKNARQEVSKPLDGWTYKNKNAVFYNPDGTALTDQEKVELAKKEKVIALENTRFKSNPWKADLQEGNMKLTAFQKRESDVGKIGIDGKDLVDPKATPTVGGYKLLRIHDPSPMVTPGAGGESPFMTWGEVESTPYRLEGCEDTIPINTAGGPSFKIQDIPKRDRLAFELAEKNSKFYRDKKNKAISTARSNIKTPKSASLSVRVATMSPAAQRLATSKLGIRLGTDKALRASYTPSPSMRRGTPTPSKATPSKATPSTSKAKFLSGVTTPKRGGSTPAKIQEDPTSLTDDLLDLPSPGTKRPKASDFL